MVGSEEWSISFISVGVLPLSRVSLCMPVACNRHVCFQQWADPSCLPGELIHVELICPCWVLCVGFSGVSFSVGTSHFHMILPSSHHVTCHSGCQTVQGWELGRCTACTVVGCLTCMHHSDLQKELCCGSTPPKRWVERANVHNMQVSWWGFELKGSSVQGAVLVST